MIPRALEDYIKITQELVSHELDEERIEVTEALKTHSTYVLEKKGVALLRLEVKNTTTSLYGRTLITFQKLYSNGDSPLPFHKLKKGDIVGVFTAKHTISSTVPLLSGVIHYANTNDITVSVNDDDNIGFLDTFTTFELCVIGSESTKNCYTKVLEKLSAGDYERCRKAIDIIFAGDNTGLVTENDIYLLPHESPAHYAYTGSKFMNQKLNPSQKRAIQLCLASQNLMLVHGPPGTGKTTTVVEYILQEVRCKSSFVLATAPSNIAVDNLIEKVVASGVRNVVRIGHPSRTSESLHDYTLDAKMLASSCGKYLQQTRSAINKLVKSNAYGMKYELTRLRKEATRLEIEAAFEVFSTSCVVFATCRGAEDYSLMRYMESGREFDVVVIDEAAQAISVTCFIPMMLGSKIIMSGDDKQLPPTIKSDLAVERGLGRTVFEMIRDLAYREQITTLLDVQYRMNSQIMEWSNLAFYEGKLSAHESVADKTIMIPPHCNKFEESLLPPFVWIDTSSEECFREDKNDVFDDVAYELARTKPSLSTLVANPSKSNAAEAHLILKYLSYLIDDCGIKQDAVGIISPYNRQVEYIRKLLHGKNYSAVECNSVDSFQGREKDVIIITCVRSNYLGEIGFLSESRRMNVATTRAMRHLCVVGDMETLRNEPVLATLVDYAKEHSYVFDSYEWIMEEEIPYRPTVELGHNGTSVRASKENQQASVVSSHKNKRLQKSKNAKIEKQRAIASDEKGEVFYPTLEQSDDGDLDSTIKAQIDRIISNKKVFYFTEELHQVTFPPTLNSYQRRLAHMYCDNEGVEHFSKDTSEGRVLVVCVNRSNIRQEEPVNDLCASVEVEQELLFEDDSSVERTGSSATVEETPRSSKEEKNYQKAKDIQEQRKKKTKESKAKKAVAADDDDDDALFEFFQNADKENMNCHFGKCGTRVVNTGLPCIYCNFKYCYTHMMPELHGCGDKAREGARKAFLNNNAIGYSKPIEVNRSINGDEAKRKVLENKLHAKLNESRKK